MYEEPGICHKCGHHHLLQLVEKPEGNDMECPWCIQGDQANDPGDTDHLHNPRPTVG